MGRVRGRAAALALAGMVVLTGTAVGHDAPGVGTQVSYIGPEGDALAAITVDAVVEPFAQYDPSSAPPRGNHYVLVEVSIENTSPRPLTLDPSGIVLQDGDGFLWTAASVSLAADADVSPVLAYGTLDPGASVQGSLVVPVLNSTALARVLFRPASDRLVVLADLTVDGSSVAVDASPGPDASPAGGGPTTPVPTEAPEPGSTPVGAPGMSSPPAAVESASPSFEPGPTPSAAATEAAAAVEDGHFHSRAYALNFPVADPWRVVQDTVPEFGADELELSDGTSTVYLSTYESDQTPQECVDATIASYESVATSIEPATDAAGGLIEGTVTGFMDAFRGVEAAFPGDGGEEQIGLYVTCWTVHVGPDALARFVLASPAAAFEEAIASFRSLLEDMRI